MTKRNVSEIEFRLYDNSELDDCILHMAELIKQNYTIYQTRYEPHTIRALEISNEPYLYIIMRKRYQ